MTMIRKRWHAHAVTALAVACIGIAAPAGTLAQTPAPLVVPPTSVYSSLSAQWWQWILGIPVGANPGLDDGGDTSGRACNVNQSGPVWFLAGTFAGGPVSRVCNVPAGKALFFPLLNTTYIFDVGETRGADFLRQSNAADINGVNTLQATIDGRKVNDLFGYRVLSPLFTYVLPADNLVGLPAGRFSPTAADGYWLLVAPLSRGTHVIHFGGTLGTRFAVDVTYRLNVGS